MIVRNIRSALTLLEVLIVLAVLCIVVALLLPLLQGPLTNRQRSPCWNHLKQIGLALHNYHDRHGCFPPAYIADPSGRPMHSWRVLILPYLDQQALYDRYDFNEPWDGPNNRRLADEFPTLKSYKCHKDDGSGTSYVAVVGPHTCWPESDPCRIQEITDGTSNTLLVVDVRDSGIHWMEPRDLHVTQMAPTINAPGGQGISSPHEGGAHGLFADGATRFLPDRLPAEDLRLLIERDDGQATPEF